MRGVVVGDVRCPGPQITYLGSATSGLNAPKRFLSWSGTDHGFAGLVRVSENIGRPTVTRPARADGFIALCRDQHADAALPARLLTGSNYAADGIVQIEMTRLHERFDEMDRPVGSWGRWSAT